MRDIKFRAWDGNKMREWGFMEKDKCGFAFYGPPASNDGNPMTMTHMRYTGILDKDGKAIFEGDILSRGRTIDRVVFMDCAFCVEFRSEKFGRVYVKSMREVILSSPRNRWTVVGNVFENPKLLDLCRWPLVYKSIGSCPDEYLHEKEKTNEQ
jgi:hypothetical protein